MSEPIRLRDQRMRCRLISGGRAGDADSMRPRFPVGRPEAVGAARAPAGPLPLDPLPVWMVPPLISKPDAAISRNLGEQTRMVLAILMPREAQVLRMRFGIGDAGVHTAEEIGRSFALSGEQILQIESRALRKLRSPGLAARLRGSTWP